MKPFEYLSAFLVLFQVVTVSEVTLGIAYSFNNFTETQYYLPHTLLTLLCFVGTFDYIIRIYGYRKMEIWNIWKFSFMIIPGICWLVLAKLLYPDLDPPDVYNFEAVFLRNRFLFFNFGGFYLLIVNLSFVLFYKKKHWAEIILSWLFGLLFIAGSFVNSVIYDYSIICGLLVVTICFHYVRTPKLMSMADK